MANLLVVYRASPYTTANYLVWAFERLGHSVLAWGPGHDPQWPPDWRPDAYIWVEAGGGPPRFIEGFRDLGVPTAAWLIDNHSQLRWHQTLAQAFDHVFVAQYAYLAAFERDVTWLPVACDPQVHKPLGDIEPRHDVVFVGHTYGEHPWYERRRELLDGLKQRYDLGLYEGSYLQRMAEAHAFGRIVFNVSTRGDLNMRVFEGLCSGRPLITDAVPGAGLDELFVPEIELYTYASEGELYGKIDRLLANPELAAQVGAAGQHAVLSAHTYEHRAGQMLGEMGL